MILGFKQQFPWKEPTNFREKILYGVGQAIWLTPRQIKKFPKIHTMREDPTNRWKAGRKIEMVYRGAGYKIIDHFNKGIPELEVFTGVQEIMLWYTGSLGQFGEDGKRKQIITMHCTIDGRIFENINTLAVNDGFSDQLQFMNWFNKINTPFRGKIIHWTNFRY